MKTCCAWVSYVTLELINEVIATETMCVEAGNRCFPKGPSRPREVIDWMQVPGRQKQAVSPLKARKLELRRGGVSTENYNMDSRGNKPENSGKETWQVYELSVASLGFSTGL